jgi:hypothetical protein
MLPLLRAGGRVMCPCPKTAVREVAARRERIDGSTEKDLDLFFKCRSETQQSK